MFSRVPSSKIKFLFAMTTPSLCFGLIFVRGEPDPAYRMQCDKFLKYRLLCKAESSLTHSNSKTPFKNCLILNYGRATTNFNGMTQ